MLNLKVFNLKLQYSNKQLLSVVFFIKIMLKCYKWNAFKAWLGIVKFIYFLEKNMCKFK